MPTHFTTLADHWNDHYLSAMDLLHTLLNYDRRVKPRQAPTPDVFVEILNKVVRGEYTPSDYFVAGEAPQRSLLSRPPPLAGGVRYSIISLNATTARSEFVSVQSGGIAFEDPVWAALAAHALSRKLSVSLPIAKNNDELWEKISLVVTAVRGKNYQPQNFLGSIKGFIPPATSAKFELITVDSDQVDSLRNRGFQSLRIAPPPKYFELFAGPAQSKQ